MHLIKQWLKAAVVDTDGNGKRRTTGGGKRKRKGTPQGGVITPLLARLYLHLLDRVWQRHELANRLGARLVRTADSLPLLRRQDIHTPMAVLQAVTDRANLRIRDAFFLLYPLPDCYKDELEQICLQAATLVSPGFTRRVNRPGLNLADIGHYQCAFLRIERRQPDLSSELSAVFALAGQRPALSHHSR